MRVDTGGTSDLVNPGHTGFYIASTDQELLNQVSQVINRNGYVGLMDTAGRIHYVIDGRRGSPYAARRIEEAAGRMSRDRDEAIADRSQQLGRIIDRVMQSNLHNSHLKGYRYLRCMLGLTTHDPTLLRPISKTLYPTVAVQFHVTTTQVERDVRYVLKLASEQPGQDSFSLLKQGEHLSNTAAICRLHDLVLMEFEDLPQT